MVSRMEHDNISDISMDRDRDCDSKPFPEGLDRAMLSNGIHHLQEQVRKV